MMEQYNIPVNRFVANVADEAQKIKERAKKASKILLQPLNTDIATLPYDIVYTEDRVSLKHYKPLKSSKSKLKTPLLVTYALINRETMLDLQPGRSVIETLIQEGIDVYVIDWGYPTRKDKYLTIDDHVNGYIDNIVDYILYENNISKLNLMGICMGGTFCAIYSALHPEKVKNLITTVSPTNFDTNQGLLHVWMKDLNIDRMTDTLGNISGDLMNFGFLLLNPARLMVDKYVSFYENWDDKQFIENFVRMEKWIFDSPDVPGETFRQFVKDGYQKNLLIQNKMKIGDDIVNLKNITMPLLNIYAKFDHLVPPEACNLLTKKVGSKDTEDVCLKTGHIGIYVSSKVSSQFAPKIVQWLKEHEEDKKDALSIPSEFTRKKAS